VAVVALLALLLAQVALGRGTADVPVPIHHREGWAVLNEIEPLQKEWFVALRPMARSADLLVEGTLGDVTKGRVFGSPGDYVYYVNVELTISDVLRGRPVTQEPGSVIVEIMLPYESAYEAVAADLPGTTGLYFLRNKKTEAASMGLPQDVQEAETYFYRFVSTQGVLTRDSASRVFAPLAEPGYFPFNLNGAAYEHVRRDTEASLRS